MTSKEIYHSLREIENVLSEIVTQNEKDIEALSKASERKQYEISERLKDNLLKEKILKQAFHITEDLYNERFNTGR